MFLQGKYSNAKQNSNLFKVKIVSEKLLTHVTQYLFCMFAQFEFELIQVISRKNIIFIIQPKSAESK